MTKNISGLLVAVIVFVLGIGVVSAQQLAIVAVTGPANASCTLYYPDGSSEDFTMTRHGGVSFHLYDPGYHYAICDGVLSWQRTISADGTVNGTGTDTNPYGNDPNSGSRVGDTQTMAVYNFGTYYNVVLIRDTDNDGEFEYYERDSLSVSYLCEVVNSVSENTWVSAPTVDELTDDPTNGTYQTYVLPETGEVQFMSRNPADSDWEVTILPLDCDEAEDEQ